MYGVRRNKQEDRLILHEKETGQTASVGTLASHHWRQRAYHKASRIHDKIKRADRCTCSFDSGVNEFFKRWTAGGADAPQTTIAYKYTPAVVRMVLMTAIVTALSAEPTRHSTPRRANRRPRPSKVVVQPPDEHMKKNMQEGKNRVVSDQWGESHVIQL